MPPTARQYPVAYLPAMNATATLQWEPGFELGEASMDAAHREFIERLHDLQQCADEEFARHLRAFRAHAEQHFGDEDRAMQGGGYASAQCHLDEHKAVLSSVAEVQALVAQGNVEVGRRLARELARWFPEHTVAMDRGLAAWSQKQRLGGARIAIVRRP